MGKEALIMVDVQNDFCPGGSLPVIEGDHVVGPLNKVAAVLKSQGGLVFASRDWHRADNTVHMNPDKWPSHCVQGTTGAEFHSDLEMEEVTVVSKGMGNEDDGYSAFEGQVEGERLLGDVLRDLGVDRVVVGGLATDYCVKATVLSALRERFMTTVLTDAIRAVNINPEDGEKALKEMEEAGVILSTSEKVIAKYLGE